MKTRLRVLMASVLCTVCLGLFAQSEESFAPGGPQQCLGCHDFGPDSPVHPVMAGVHGEAITSPDAEQREFFVFSFVKCLATESGKNVRETDRDVRVVGVHVSEALFLFPGARPDLVEGRRHILDAVEADGCRETREWILEFVVEPPIAPFAVRDSSFRPELAAEVGEFRSVAHDSRTATRVF